MVIGLNFSPIRIGFNCINCSLIKYGIYYDNIAGCTTNEKVKQIKAPKCLKINK